MTDNPTSQIRMFNGDNVLADNDKTIGSYENIDS